MRVFLLASSAATISLLMLAACGESGQVATGAQAAPAAPASAAPRAPEETRPPNARGQTPAFEGQTRAPRPAVTEAWRLEEVATGLTNIWAFEFLPDGDMIVTERDGRVRIASLDGNVSEPLEGAPEVVQGGQAGLFDVALAPDFAQSRRVYFTYAEPRESGLNGTSVAVARLSDDRSALENLEVIFRQTPESGPPFHYGSRMAFAQDGTLFVTLGDRFFPPAREAAATPRTYLGKVVRMNPDGSVPADNPFADGADGEPYVWSFGHRSPQGAVVHPETGQLWTTEHGPAGGDELNRPEAGKNYGWPFVTYGQDYSGQPMYDGLTRAEGVEQPVYYWDPVIAPSGMDFYTGDLFPAWRGDLFIAGMATQKVGRLTFDEAGERVTGEEWLQTPNRRIRDVRQGPDGALYLATDDAEAAILRIVPQ